MLEIYDKFRDYVDNKNPNLSISDLKIFDNFVKDEYGESLIE